MIPILLFLIFVAVLDCMIYLSKINKKLKGIAVSLGRVGK
jgi:hypothetical protein